MDFWTNITIAIFAALAIITVIGCLLPEKQTRHDWAPLIDPEERQ